MQGILKPGNEAVLRLLAIRGQEERQSEQADGLLVEYSAEIVAARVRRSARAVLCLQHLHLHGDPCGFLRASSFSTCLMRTPLQEKFAPFFIRSKIAPSPSWLMTVTLVRSMTSWRPPKSWLAFLQVVPSSAIHGPMKVPSTRSVRRHGASAMDILNM